MMPTNNCWEDKVYTKGLQLNKYPYDEIVSLVFRLKNRQDNPVNKVLEIGCGAGNNLWFCAREGLYVSGIDSSSSAINYAKERFSKEGLVGDFTVGNFQSLPWGDNVFDLVIDRMAMTCCHPDVIKKTVGEVHRVLKPHGTFFSTMYTRFRSF